MSFITVSAHHFSLFGSGCYLVVDAFFGFSLPMIKMTLFIFSSGSASNLQHGCPGPWPDFNSSDSILRNTLCPTLVLLPQTCFYHKL